MNIRMIETTEELGHCADMMHTSEPWIQLGFTKEDCIKSFEGNMKENYVVTDGNEIAGFVILQVQGAFSGYVQTICIAQAYRNKTLGSRLLQFCEDRIFATMRNVFLCVSSFNTGGQRFYLRHGYEKVGALKDHIVHGCDEYLLRKTLGPRYDSAT